MSVTDQETLRELRSKYPEGCRVRLIIMDDVQAPPVGTEGTIKFIDDIGTAHIAWDNGSSLGAVLKEDIIERITLEVDQQKKYKVEPYKVTAIHDAITDRDKPWENSFGYKEIETRYRVVSIETGEILDDAQGFGYKTAQKAHAAYAYKNRDRSKDKDKHRRIKHIEKWIKENTEFVEAMDKYALEIAKGSWGPDAKFNTAFLRDMLNSYGLAPDFSASELLQTWRKLK